jgi:hypothetical protein
MLPLTGWQVLQGRDPLRGDGNRLHRTAQRLGHRRDEDRRDRSAQQRPRPPQPGRGKGRRGRRHRGDRQCLRREPPLECSCTRGSRTTSPMAHPSSAQPTRAGARSTPSLPDRAQIRANSWPRRPPAKRLTAVGPRPPLLRVGRPGRLLIVPCSRSEQPKSGSTSGSTPSMHVRLAVCPPTTPPWTPPTPPRRQPRCYATRAAFSAASTSSPPVWPTPPLPPSAPSAKHAMLSRAS